MIFFSRSVVSCTKLSAFFVHISLVISFYIKNEKEKELLHQSYMTLRDTLIDTLVEETSGDTFLAVTVFEVVESI